MPFISVFSYAGFMALIALLAGHSQSVLAQDKMHKHDHMKHQHIKGATQPATSGRHMDEAKLDLRAEKMTNSGHFKVSLSSQAAPVKINHMHNWVLVVKGDGGAIKGAKISVGGGMPAHGHGLPTAPRVTTELGAGEYLVEGIRFNMGGHWELTFRIASAQKAEKVTFNLLLN